MTDPRKLAERIDEIAQEAYSFSVDIGRDYEHCNIVARKHPTKEYTYMPVNIGAVLSICAEILKEHCTEKEDA